MKKKLVQIACSILGFSAIPLLAQSKIHPGFTIQTVSFTGTFTTTPARPLVGGMDIFPDGRVAVVEWGVPANVYIFSGLATATNNIPAKLFAKGLDNALGLRIVDNEIYVMEKEGLTHLKDTDNDGIADQYNSINQTFSSNSSMLNFSYDLGYVGGSFFAAMSSDVKQGGYDWGSSKHPTPTALKGRSTMYKLNVDGTSSAFASGFRNPNGMGTNGSDIFVSDNQGSWTPSSKIIHVKSGKFYGHRTNPPEPLQVSNSDVETPPLAWCNKDDGNTTGISAGNPLVLKQGRFKGQMLVPDLDEGKSNPVFRIFVEKIGGDFQGCIFPFLKGDVQSGVHRIQEAPNGDIYLGILGSNGGWDKRTGMAAGFQVLKDNKSTIFEIKAIRSKSNNTFELEFTKPVGSAADQTGTYTVEKWQQRPSEGYGAGNRSDVTGLTVTNAAVSSDRMKVTLTISNLTAKWLIKFKINSLTAQDGNALWTTWAAYTLTQFGPGADMLPVPIAEPKQQLPNLAGWKIESANGFHWIRFQNNAPRTISLFDLQGHKISELPKTSNSQVRLETAQLSRGMHLVRVIEQGKTSSRAFFIR